MNDIKIIKDDKYYQDLLKIWYNPRGFVIQNHKKVNQICKEMLESGYTKDQIYTIVDEARAFHGLEVIKR